MLETLKEFISKRIELFKMEAEEKAVLLFSFITFIVILLIAFIFFIIFFNIGIALYIGQLLGNYAYGVLIIAAFYLILIFITVLCRKSIKNKVSNYILKSFND